MADEQPNGAAGPENPAPPQLAAAAAVTPDAQTADILRRHSAGERLTPSEGGKLGQWKKKIKNALGGGSPPVAAPAPPSFSPAAVRIPVTPPPADSPMAVGAGVASVDPGIARRTALAIVRRLDAVAVRFVSKEARLSGVQGATLDDFTRKAALAAEDQALIGDLAPDACAELGIDPKATALYTVGVILAAHSASLMMAVMELRELRADKPVARREQPPEPEPTPAPPAK